MPYVLILFILISNAAYAALEVEPDCGTLRQRVQALGIGVEGNFLEAGHKPGGPLSNFALGDTYDRYTTFFLPRSPISEFSLFGYDTGYGQLKGLRIQVFIEDSDQRIEKNLVCLVAKGEKISKIYNKEGHPREPEEGRGLNNLCQHLIEEVGFKVELIAYLKALLAEAGY